MKIAILIALELEIPASLGLLTHCFGIAALGFHNGFTEHFP
jgi:hypothetical protein